jgi:chromate transport protein ChrA
MHLQKKSWAKIAILVIFLSLWLILPLVSKITHSTGIMLGVLLIVTIGTLSEKWKADKVKFLDNTSKISLVSLSLILPLLTKIPHELCFLLGIFSFFFFMNLSWKVEEKKPKTNEMLIEPVIA